VLGWHDIRASSRSGSSRSLIAPPEAAQRGDGPTRRECVKTGVSAASQARGVSESGELRGAPVIHFRPPARRYRPTPYEFVKRARPPAGGEHRRASVRSQHLGPSRLSLSLTATRAPFYSPAEELTRSKRACPSPNLSGSDVSR